MIIYIENSAKQYRQTQKIIKKFNEKNIVYIDHYKNIFDKDFRGSGAKKVISIAELRSPAITPAPPGYGHTPNSFFIKTSLGCVFDCDYCYLKGAFKNDNIAIFTNYEDIKEQITQTIQENDNESNEKIWFYSGDYSDIIGMNNITNFVQEFVPFFEKYDNVMMEIRTKSADISSLLSLGFVPNNTEIAYSLNPQQLIDIYEKGTASLDKRIEAINILISKGYKVGLRFLPLLPVKNYKTIYTEFIEYIKKKIDMEKIYSSFASGLLYTKSDYNKILKKYPTLDILHMLEANDDAFYRESREMRNWFYENFKSLDKGCIFCLEIK